MEVRMRVGWSRVVNLLLHLRDRMHPSRYFKPLRHMKISWWLMLHENELENYSPIVDIRRDCFDVFELRSVNSPARTRSNLSKSLSIGSFSWES